MSNEINETSPLQQRFAEVFARLHDQDIEQFYAHYQLWVLRQRVPFLEKQIETLREHIAENQRQIEQLQPPAIALAVLARLQSNGVKDIALLDQMLERGEDWLDRMMQRLDYCEQVEDFIQGDYTQWCVNSLEGAYDWIDSLRDAPSEETPPSQAVEQPAADEIQATEELLLQKLSTDDEEAMLEVTLKRPAIQLTQTVEGTAEAEEQPAVEEATEATAGEQLTELTPAAEGEEEEAGESEIPVEMSGWQDLESPEEPAEPWYSVSLKKDASPQGEQAPAMNDWITILQAENPAQEETSEAAALPAENEEQVESAEAEQTEASTTEQAEPETISTEELAPESENEEETVVVPESEEEPAPEESEVGAAEMVKVESEPEQGDVAASEEMLVESPSEEEERGTEHETAEAEAAASTQIEPAEAEGAAYILSSEVAEGELIDAAKAIEFLSIAEEPAAEVEELEAVEAGSSEQEQTADVETPEEAEIHVEEDTALATTAQPAEGDAQAEEAEPAIAVAEQEEAEAPAVEETPKEAEQAEPQGGQDIHPFRAEEAQEQEGQEVSSPRAEEAQEQEISSIANVVEEEQIEAPSLIGAGEMQETAPIAGEEEQAANPVEGREAEEQSLDVEGAAIANDILGPEGEQLAWYEYLELDKQDGVSPSEPGEEQVEPEERPGSDEAEPPEDTAEMPELHEYVVAVEGEQASTPEEAARQEEPMPLEEEQIEIEGWQTWGTQQEDDDNTLPMPRKEIAQEQELPASAEPEPQFAMSEVMEQMGVDERIALSESVANPGESLPAAAAGEVIVMDRQAETSEPGEAPAQFGQAVPVSSPAPGEKQPEKRSFWQRLFGWMRKK